MYIYIYTSPIGLMIVIAAAEAENSIADNLLRKQIMLQTVPHL